ncbi:MAG: prepilin-type N-terminal cleavage/methylation domain-containing protein [Synergistaceae bacterium]|nr:prepilin-type N-terminal cleavage/methylation domain-containing protein [Synergistaceae bacterium]
MKKNTKREGFTLVELLIVIVVIGVLSAMMMLSSTEAVSSAKAADIVSDLRNLKTAALAWYADNLDYVGGTKINNKEFNNLQGERASIIKYMNNENIDTKYDFGGNKTTGTWFVWYNIGSDTKVKEKLISRKSSTGLWGTTTKNATQSGDLDASSTYVGMFIR